MAHCVRHEQCPKCAARGNDRSRNNLAVYSDGSMYCFSCHYSVSASGVSRIKSDDQPVREILALPHDADTDLPQKAQDYLDKFGLTLRDRQFNTIMWSEFWQRLIFPYFDDTGLVGWQGRYLGDDGNLNRDKAKWYSKGNLRDLIHVVGNKNAGTVVLVEDIVSAIKISHIDTVCAVPLFGSHVDVKKVLAIKKICDTIKVWCWLDLDKQVDSAKYSKKLRDLGFESRTVITEFDPKLYDDAQIEEILGYG